MNDQLLQNIVNVFKDEKSYLKTPIAMPFSIHYEIQKLNEKHYPYLLDLIEKQIEKQINRLKSILSILALD